MSRASNLLPRQVPGNAPEPYQQLLALPAHEQTCAKLRELCEAYYSLKIDRHTQAATAAALSQLRLSSSRPS